ncbi:MFS transporter [Carnobacterium divergens]|uniref:MFS transporter n=1 Tax=Carnobacterium divergens TaxID=2748 RepID=UPI00107218AB|nr:MFS transporter [Carnobacterium divergens]TFJ46976.1 MFS transporter [Carnobacterium divergens]TFJ53940.1 MFS transporter [Carnobacterium divergens]
MRKNPYFPTVMSLYTNYILQGMAAIILAQNMTPLMKQFGTTATGMSLVISSIGLGRILILYFAGRMSDKFGRKRIVLMGMASYVVFFGGILISNSIWVASFFTLFAGFANALLDTGTYPALMEAYPASSGFMSVLNKAFISAGQFILPILVGALLTHQLYYGISFILCLGVICANLLVMSQQKFPPIQSVEDEREYVSTQTTHEKSKFWLEGVALILFGFTSVSTFNIIVLWLPQYAEQLAGMAKGNSLMLISLYSIGSLISVFLTAFIVKKWVQPIVVILSCTMASFLVLGFVLLFPTEIGASIAAFGIGLFSSGGIWQLALTLLLQLFPKNKGQMTSYYTLMTSFSVMLIPLITGSLSEINIRLVMIFNAGVTLVGFLLAVFVFIRCQRLSQIENKAILVNETMEY